MGIPSPLGEEAVNAEKAFEDSWLRKGWCRWKNIKWWRYLEHWTGFWHKRYGRLIMSLLDMQVQLTLTVSLKAAGVAFVLEHLRVIKLGDGGGSFDFRMEFGKMDIDIVSRK